MSDLIPTGRPVTRVALLLVGGALAGAYAHLSLAWPLGFVLLVPWLLGLEAVRHWRDVLLLTWLQSVVFCVAVFAWFGAAFGEFTGVGVPAGIASLAVLAPFLQPQFFAFAIARRWASRQHGTFGCALIASAAWVACEAVWPKLLGDTLGHGLHAAPWLRQAADLGGATGLTLLLLLSNEALTWAWRHRRPAAPRWWRVVATVIGSWLLVATYGGLRVANLHAPSDQTADTLRVALVQGNQTDYERRRQEVGAYAVVREALDTHYALSWSARRDHGADALVWSETVYPTTFGQARSADGAALDSEIQGFVDAAGIPLIFGSYDADAAGEYNAAFFLQPDAPPVGRYRKSYPFPFSERVPDWLDTPWLRTQLPWLGSWQAGDGARTLPLRSRDGRSVEVAPLICLDAVHPQLAIDGARLGAQALLSMSNDSWFTAYPAGARLHLRVAAFRSVETGLPQLRVTTNGHSAVIDASGEILAQTGMGQQAVLTGELRAITPPPTLMVRWGDWVGRSAALTLLLWCLWTYWKQRRIAQSERDAAPAVLQLEVVPASLRRGIQALRLIAALGLAAIAIDMGTRIGWQVQTRGQLLAYATLVLTPLLVAALLYRLARKVPMTSPQPADAGWRRRLANWQAERAAKRRQWFDHALVKFGVFPLLPALLAFRLHQMITFGGSMGEWQALGASSWLGGLLLWWASWSLGLMLLAAAMRCGIESLILTASLLAPASTPSLRDTAEAGARTLFYVGVPVWLLWRMLGG